MRFSCRPILLILFLVVSTTACADVVTDWNSISLELIKATDMRPPIASRALAMVHTAIYDSVNAISPTYEVYYVQVEPPNNTSPKAAAASAAHRVLSNLFPDQKAFLDKELVKSLSYLRGQQAINNGVLLGRYVADTIIQLRENDGSDLVVPYTPGDEPGEWRPTPPNYSSAVLPNWPYVTPFAIPCAEQFQPGPPPCLTSREYAANVNEVILLGGTRSFVRTKDQTEIAYFWADDFQSVTPPGRWNIIAQIAGNRKGNSLIQNARLFALMNVAMADSAIVAWSCKYNYNLWRPITAIQEASTDGNKWTAEFPNWTSLLPTPAFSEYISGHSTFGASAAVILINFFGTDNFTFLLESDVPQARARLFKSFSSAALENGRSRIYGGIHFEFGNNLGLQAGQTVGGYVYGNIMQPI